MKISVFGTGYVGLVTGVCFAEMGNDVICVDIDPKKVEMLKQSKSPIYEPGLDELLKENSKARRLQFTTDAKMAIDKSDIIFIAVGTPPKEDGSADLQYVLGVAEEIASNMNSYKLIINKSTVPVGTAQLVKKTIRMELQSRGLDIQFDIASNPEFLREGCAIEDCLKPARVVVGVESQKAQDILQNLYEPFLKNGNPFLAMDPYSSEMTKYAANAMLAAKISIMNEFSRFCEKVGADIENVRKGVGSDGRIGSQFIYAGIGYGGSCFPKDVSALIQMGEHAHEDMKILKAVEETNQIQRQNFYKKMQAKMGSLKGKRVAVWGIAFKPGTDDIREAPALYLIDNLLSEGAEVIAYDPVASDNAKKYFDNNPKLHFVDDQYKAVEGVDALCIPTEWKSFREPDFEKIKKLMKSALIFDGRNIYSPKNLKAHGFDYISVGRPTA
jgi:UDPglucose 6-dehydrogenase